MAEKIHDQPAEAGRSTISISGIEYLLVDAGSVAVHLVARGDRQTSGDTPTPRTATPRRAQRFNALVLDDGWLTTTLCGREWLHPATEAGGVWAPDCRTCLRLVDRRLGTEEPDERIPLLVELVSSAITNHGSAEVIGVPGDQLATFRAAVRARLRAQGFRSRTYVEGELLLITSHDARDAMSDEARRQHQLELAEALQRISLGGAAAPVDTSGWRFRWSDWAF